MQPAVERLVALERVLVVDTISWRPHLETSMEIALVAREQGAKVRYLNLRSALPAVEDASWLPRAFDLNALRVRRAKPLLAQAGIEVSEPSIRRAEVARAAAAAGEMLARCADIAALCRLQYDGFDDVGWGTLSSTVEATRNPFVSLHAHRKLLQRFLASALLVYDAVRGAIRDFSPDAVVLFNGRYATTRPILAAARSEGVRALFHERGCDRNHYWLAPESVHDPDYVQGCIRDFWRPELAAAGEQYFNERRGRVEKAWLSYTKRQTQGRIPAAMQDSARWVVFFTSSDDEFVAIGDKYVNEAFPAQIDALRAVMKVVEALPGYRLCVRMHPNIASKSEEQVAFWRNVQVPGGIVVGPEEDFDSYAILERSHVACSYGSTIGIEATFWARPSLLLGRSIYDRLGATFNAGSLDEIRSFLLEPRAYPRLGALMFGAYFGLFGTRYRHYESEDLFRGRILGTALDSAAVRVARALSGDIDRFIHAVSRQ